MRPTPLTATMIGAVALAGIAGISTTSSGDNSAKAETLQINAIIRDFKAHHEVGGHPDFQRFSGSSRVGIVKDQLGEDGVPGLASRFGSRISREYRDSSGLNVRPQFIIDGTIPGTHGLLEPRADARVTSEDSFGSWFRDVPGVNMSTVVPITLAESSPGSGVFVFDSANIDPELNPRFHDLPIQGFFPINGQLHGNYSGYHGGSTNFHFTTEIATQFQYERGEGYVFHFSGDDDVWVFIDGRLVIDLGSVHAEKHQSINLDELPWLQDGRQYDLRIFHAERRTVASNFKMATTIPLRPFANIMVSDAFD